MIGIRTDFAYFSGERSYTLSNYTKGALTHHPGGAVVFPLETVRSSSRQEPPSAVALRNAPAGAVRGDAASAEA